MAVRRSNLCKLTSCSKSNVRQYLRRPTATWMSFQIKCSRIYLDVSTMSACMRTKLLFKAGSSLKQMLYRICTRCTGPVQHLHARKHETTYGR
jgi:hypothetical protein